jgi:hypothetical protein
MLDVDMKKGLTQGWVKEYLSFDVDFTALFKSLYKYA